MHPGDFHLPPDDDDATPSPWITADQATEEGWYWVSTETYPARLEVTPTGDRYIWRRGSQPMVVPETAMFCRIQPKPAI